LAKVNNRTLVFFPTYNEVGNVGPLIRAIRRYLPAADVLVVDDASPDGTGELLERIAEELGRIFVIHRPGKLGLGSAHKLAMMHARDEQYDRLITMDADFSHNPRYLPRFLELLEHDDFVTGSRYVLGGRSDYGFARTLISRTANLLAKAALGLELEENTTMFRGFTLDLLRRLDLESIRSEGYSFAVESIHQVAQVTRRLAEFPIHFENRAAGASKISKREIYKAIVTIQRLGLQRLVPRRRREPRGSSSDDQAAVRCASCGGRHHSEVYPARVAGHRSRLADASPYSCATHSSRTHGRILRCLTCGLVFMEPRLSAEALVGEYAAAEDPVYLENIRARETTFRYNLNKVQPLLPPGSRILEVGSYCGAFLKVAKESGFDVSGLEPSRWAVGASRAVTDAPVFAGTLKELPPNVGPFDAIIAWDVLEHFADPLSELAAMNRLLPLGGTMVFSTLMIDNWFPRMAGRYWPWLMDMHLFYFTEESVRRILDETGFRVVEDDKYCHVVTLEYLLAKLGTLGVPLSGAAGHWVGRSSIGRVEIPFRFGDIKYFVCRKTANRDPRANEEPPSSSNVGVPRMGSVA
jgi:dolichol-phosphate mannosyltransferase